MDNENEKYIVTLELESDLSKGALAFEVSSLLQAHNHIEIKDSKFELAKDKTCHHVFPRIKMGCHLPNCIKCDISLGLMPYNDTWEWE